MNLYYILQFDVLELKFNFSHSTTPHIGATMTPSVAISSYSSDRKRNMYFYLPVTHWIPFPPAIVDMLSKIRRQTCTCRCDLAFQPFKELPPVRDPKRESLENLSCTSSKNSSLVTTSTYSYNLHDDAHRTELVWRLLHHRMQMVTLNFTWCKQK